MECLPSFDFNTMEYNIPERFHGVSGAARPSDPSGRTVTAGLEEKLGLKLIPSRRPMQVVVIERMDKPDAN